MATKHPSYEVMIKKAITELHDRKGASRPAIKKYILANYTVPERFTTSFNTQLRRLVANGKITSIGGHRFKIPK